ncbi:unnamed protein product [Onchocerca flexuosa]|uniref:Uncharacterized protein n=1 Tax=Onchocerca flexuosa TaxID=387005 RepID=A0A183H7S5_9BILA|nr:unnamed protein product [Onchocerca flexuosa]
MKPRKAKKRIKYRFYTSSRNSLCRGNLRLIKFSKRLTSSINKRICRRYQCLHASTANNSLSEYDEKSLSWKSLCSITSTFAFMALLIAFVIRIVEVFLHECSR